MARGELAASTAVGCSCRRMERPVLSLFMLVPGPWSEATEVAHAFRERGIDVRTEETSPIERGEVRVSLIEDDNLAQAFSWGRHGPLAPELIAPVAACSHAALIEVGWQLQESAPVERLVSESPAIAMELPDVLALERFRGSADIEPELAWEQWQIVRTSIL